MSGAGCKPDSICCSHASSTLRSFLERWTSLASGIIHILNHDSRSNSPEDVKASYPKASILKGSRVVFNIKGNDYRLIASVQYQAGVLAIRFFGTHAEYDKIDAEIV
jgi:mRNA interferase HigB